MKILWLIAGLTLFAATVLPAAGCAAPQKGSPEPATAPVTGTTTMLVDNSTSISLSVVALPAKPDKVELTYFHRQAPCHCMAVVGDSIQQVVDTYFQDEQASGRLKLTQIVSDDPANVEMVKRYDTLAFALFVTETRGGIQKTYTLDDIWLMTGDENHDKLVNYLRTELTEILQGKDS